MIVLSNLTLRRGAKVLLDGTSVTIHPGEKVALVGRNGAGKSTLLRLLNGLLRPDAGQITLDSTADVPATTRALCALPGIGDWTAQYIAMRVLRWPDAFVAGDVALHKALGVQGQKQPAEAATEASVRWQCNICRQRERRDAEWRAGRTCLQRLYRY